MNCHVAKFMQIQQHKLGLFSVYDGHLGDIISSYLKKHLFANILNKIGCAISFSNGLLLLFLKHHMLTFFYLLLEEFWVDPFRLMRKQIKQFFHKAQTWVVVDPLL
uniref:PPM-type phosphatase domain-containing protein n=2 Tax=Gossypium raimondii TaxID=29730 RepID=A0A0D2VBX9_GOSRA|nr:hypothetical protein B456_013G101700 [Gossypium raimondii]